MSMDAGGLVQMTYNNNNYPGNTPSFGSRGKGSHLRNISVPVSQNNLSAPSVEKQPVTTPRTARSALLAGLRTAPKTPVSAAMPTPQVNENSLENSKYASSSSSAASTVGSFSARAAARNSGNNQNQNVNRYQGPQNTPRSANTGYQQMASNQGYSNGEMMETMDEAEAEMYQQLLATNYILTQQQAQLQQQLASFAASSVAARQAQILQQQIQQLQLQSTGQAGFANPPLSPGGMNMYMQQQMSQNNANMVAGGGGYYPLYNNNAVQSQYGYYVQQQQQQQQQQVNAAQYQQVQQQAQQQVQQQQQAPVAQPESPPLYAQQQQQQTSSVNNTLPLRSARSRSPPKLNLQQQPTSTTPPAGFKRGHRKASSLSTCININNLEIDPAPKTSLPRLSMLPSTPLTATFAPGHASGSHPIRQPRGPPSIEELKAKPTSTVEGSKNFATRQRRRAVSRLVTSSLERRSARSASGTMTPVSENEGFAFDNESVASSLSGRQSNESLRGGSGSPQEYSASSVSGDESGSVSGKESAGRLKAPRLVFSADKRRSAMF
jgi:hypothetical protein